MNYIKTTIPKAGYKVVEPLGKKYILHILPEEVDEDNYVCVETMLDHEPSKAEIADIAADAKEYYADLQRKEDERNIKQEVKELKQKLADTDYMAIKFAEGWISTEDYAPTKAQRQAWRDRINELENS